MYDENAYVKIKWNNTNRSHFENLGYIYTKRYDEFNVKIKHLAKNSKIKIQVQCDYCGIVYTTSYCIVSEQTTHACKKCNGKKERALDKEKRGNMIFSQIEDICSNYGYSLITKKEDYINCYMDIVFLCPKHGVQTMVANNLLRNHECRECSYEKRAVKMKLSIQEVKQKIESINNNTLLNPSEYKTVIDRNLKILCGCGNPEPFITSYRNYIDHNINRCPKCVNKRSSGELIIEEYLKTNKYNYVTQKRFDDCRDNKPLPFDFYLPNYNIIIEFDGQYHYFPIYNENDLKKTQYHDKIKNKYCEDKGIKLIRIPYWEGSNVKKILDDNL